MPIPSDPQAKRYFFVEGRPLSSDNPNSRANYGKELPNWVESENSLLALENSNERMNK